MKRTMKKISLSIVLVLVLALSAFMASIGTVSAANVDTYAFLSVDPNPIGVGQPVLVVMWLNLFPPTAAGAQGDRWTGFTVLITKPDGTTQNMGPYTSDPVGSQYFAYVPEIVGNYTFVFNFPGQALNSTGNFYKASTSALVQLKVQQQAIIGLSDTPLPNPNDFWNRPISADNRNWWQISGNWLMSGYSNSVSGYGGGVNPYSKAPNSAHIVWTRPIAFGGLVGGELGDINYYTGLSYDVEFTPPIIMQGRLYYNTAVPPRYGFYCIDLRTGEELWFNNETGSTLTNWGQNVYRRGAVTLGQTYDYESPNQHGALGYLWTTGSVYHMYDAFSGHLILTLGNASTGTNVFASDGSLLVYILNGASNWIALWNSSKAIPPQGPSSSDAWQWRPDNVANWGAKILDWNKGIEWNVTVPDVTGAQTIRKIDGGVIWARSEQPPTVQGVYDPYVVDIGYDAKTGAQLWFKNRTADFATGNVGMGPMQNGVMCVFIKERLAWYGYDIFTGNQIWGPSEPYTNAWGMYSRSSVAIDGKLIQPGFDGYIHCYDIKTGKHLWDYYEGSTSETPYGTYPFSVHGGVSAADGKVFACNGEHSPNSPLYRGEKLQVVNITSGKLVWSILGWWDHAGAPPIADGYLVALNSYDNQLYCFGKGQTTTTVTAPNVGVAQGTSVLLQGTVMDQSPAQKGTPAISDDSMTAWMEYVNMQKLKPDNATGVPVTLTAIDPNGNFQTIGTTKSTSAGTFAIPWVPPVPGLYKITASFAGSESYFSSSAETSLYISQAVTSPHASSTPTATVPAPTQTSTSTQSASPSIAPQPTSGVPTVTYVAISAVIIIIAIAAAAIILRKRK
jgi:hypothetical protein